MQIERGQGNGPVRAPRPAGPQTADGGVSTPETAAPPAPAAETRGPARGVVDKLASGHFNDVAAIRLRINHAEAIAASGVTLPDVPSTTSQPGRGFEKALAAYQATREPAVPDAPASTDQAAPVDPVDPDAVVVDPVTTDPVVDDQSTILEPVIDGAALVDELLDGIADPTDPATVVAEDESTSDPVPTS